MITSIGQFLQSMGLQARYFDMGRQITEIGSSKFQQFEHQESAYPTPYLHHAWFALLLWDAEAVDTPLLWFLKFPLDEQGKLVLAERDQFLKQLLVALGSNLEATKQGKQLAAVLEGNPYVFTPAPERQAAIHARVNLLLKRPPSDHYQAAVHYLSGNLNHWQELGVQGLADLAVRWQEHQDTLTKALADMPAQPLISLCQCLENESINGALGRVLKQRVDQVLDSQTPNTTLLAALIRGLSQCQALELRQKVLLRILGSAAAEDIEILVSIGTRCGQDLCTPTLCVPFLEALAKHRQDSFNHVLSDLLFSPALRPHIVACFESTQLSQTLTTAIKGLLTKN